MEIIYSFTLGLWALALLLAWVVWLIFPTAKPQEVSVSIAVVIPVRNEATNLPALLDDLANQSQLPEEVWILDDGSTDGSAELIRSRQADFPVPLHLWTSDRPEQSPISPKKYALTTLVPQLNTDWIITTDGDCRVPRHWIKTIASQTPNRVFLAGPISFIPAKKGWVWAQSIELASLQFIAAVTLFLKVPTMCSAANMAFQRTSFPGFAGNEHIASGDDEFLMHTYHQKFFGQVAWVKSPEALVLTQAQTSWSSFVSQRKRWASKWNRYDSWAPQLLAVFVFLVNVLTLVAMFLGDFQWVLFRWLVEIGVLATYLLYFNQRKWIWGIPIVQLVYAAYVVFFGIISQRKTSYRWKGRQWD